MTLSKEFLFLFCFTDEETEASLGLPTLDHGSVHGSPMVE